MHSAVLFAGSGPLLLHGFAQVFWVGVGGGLLAELVALYELRHNVTSELPKYLKSTFYWFIVAAMALAGGGLTALYGFEEVQAILALNIGISAPLMLRTLAQNAPTLTKPRID